MNNPFALDFTKMTAHQAFDLAGFDVEDPTSMEDVIGFQFWKSTPQHMVYIVQCKSVDTKEGDSFPYYISFMYVNVGIDGKVRADLSGTPFIEEISKDEMTTMIANLSYCVPSVAMKYRDELKERIKRRKEGL